MSDLKEKQMIVGYGITVDGRIENCDRLVLDGNMNCELSDLKSLIISETGYFKGKGHIEKVEISGRFEGELVVDGHITIMETGQVNGKITYKSIEIKPGGKFTGEIILQDSQSNKKDSAKSSVEKNGSDEATADIFEQALRGQIMKNA